MDKSCKEYIKAGINIISFFFISLTLLFLLPKAVKLFFPFMIGWGITLVANPIVQFLEQKLKIKRKQGSIIVILVVIMLLILAAWFIGMTILKESIQFFSNLPSIWESIQKALSETNKFSFIDKYIPADFRSIIVYFVSDINQLINEVLEKIEHSLLDYMGNLALSIPDIFVNLVLSILFVYFCTADIHYLPELIDKTLSSSLKEKLKIIRKGFTDAFGGYIKAQIKIEIWIFILLLTGLFMIGVKYAVPVALFISITDFLPVFGTGTILIPWTIISVLNEDYKTAVGLLIVWGLSLIIRQIIQPKIIGDTVGLKPIPTTILLLSGYRIAGIAGMLFSVPLGMVILSLYKEGLFDSTISSFRFLVKSIYK